jgi:hypothetical protein
MKIEINIIGGVAGKALIINDTRVAGPKPWGGGRVLETFMVERQAIIDALPKDDTIPSFCPLEDAEVRDGHSTY